MKKTFSLTNPKVKLARFCESVKSKVRTYLKKERLKPLPEGVDYWDFACKFGPSPEEARIVHLAEIDACIEQAEKDELTSFYIEIIAKEGRRQKKSKPS